MSLQGRNHSRVVATSQRASEKEKDQEESIWLVQENVKLMYIKS